MTLLLHSLPSRIPPLALLGTLMLTACSSSEEPRPRCPTCGMYADMAPRFVSSATGGEATMLFDSPKCLFRYVATPEGARLTTLRFTEYYSQNLMDVSALRFVKGSDVRSPMGADLIPIATAQAAAFAEDHGGEVLEAQAITADVLSALQ